MDDSEETGCSPLKAAIETVNCFASVGAKAFDLTFTDQHGKKIDYRAGIHCDALRRDLPELMKSAESQRHNIIIRPRGPGMQFIQLDDLDADKLRPLHAVAFLQLETSPGNYQAWIALPAGQDDDFARRLRKGAGADPTASGATRIAGHPNFKDKYAPDFPRVGIAHSNPALRVTPDQLKALGLVTAPETTPAKPVRVSPSRPGPDKRKWPSYAISLQGAPPNHSGTAPDVSRADFTWAMTAITWGWSIEETAARLMEESTKAKENGEQYALLTAQNASTAVERRGRQRGEPL